MTPKEREAAQMALDVLIDAADSQSWELQQNIDQHGEWYRRSVYLKEAVTKSQEAIESLRAALAQPEQEPVAYDINGATVYIKPPVYTAPPQREWQGLTEMERVDIIDEEITAQNTEHFALAQAIEAKLKEKNHG